MNVRGKPTFKLATLFLVFCIGQLYVLGGSNMYAAPSPQEPIGSRVALLNGKLIIGEDETVLLNGNTVTTGTTILSGAEIDTPDKVSAEVMLPSGNVRISPSSSLALSFSAETIQVNLTKGCASLLANQNVRGEVVANQTLAWQSDPSKSSSAQVCLDHSGRARVVLLETRETVSEDLEVCGIENFAIPAAAAGGFPAGLFFAAGAAVLGGFLIFHGHSNPSPISPTT